MEKTPPPYSTLQFPTIQPSSTNPIRFSILFEGLSRFQNNNHIFYNDDLLKAFYFAYSDIEGSFEEKLFEKKTYPGYEIYSIKRKTNVGEIILDFYHLSFAKVENLKIDKKITIYDLNKLLMLLNYGRNKRIGELRKQFNESRDKVQPKEIRLGVSYQTVRIYEPLTQNEIKINDEIGKLEEEIIRQHSDVEKLTKKEIQKLFEENNDFTSEQSQLVFYHNGDLQVNFDFDVQINRKNYFLTTISPSSKSSEAFYLSILRELTKNNFLSFGDDDPEEIEILRRAQEILKKKKLYC